MGSGEELEEKGKGRNGLAHTTANPPRVEHQTESRAQSSSVQQDRPAVSREDAGISDLIHALREDARMREEEAARRHREQLEWMQRLETTSGAHTTNLAQLNMQTAALNLMLDDLNNRMTALERGAGTRQATGPAGAHTEGTAEPVAAAGMSAAAAAEVTVPVGELGAPEAPRGRKGMREEASEPEDAEGRPSKRHAQEDFESAAEADPSNL